MTNKPPRFQLFLHEWHDLTCQHAASNQNTLSTEVRRRVARSFWLDRLEIYIRQQAKTATGERLDTLRELIAHLDTAKQEIIENARTEA